MPIEWSMVVTLINLIPYPSWLEIGLGLSFFFNVVFGMLTIGVIYVLRKPSKWKINRRLADITIGGLFGLLGSFFVASINKEGPFKEPIIMIVAFGCFIGILFLLLYSIFNPPDEE